MPDIFLSYSRTDKAKARRYADAFKAEGFDVWWDAGLRAGEAYDQVTEKALEEARAVVVLWSRTSVESRWVRAEATQADRNKKLVPVMIEDCKRPMMFELIQTADLARWKGRTEDPTWQAFLANLRKFVDREADPAISGGAKPKPSAAPAWRKPAVLTGLVIAAAAILVGSLIWMVSKGGLHHGGVAASASGQRRGEPLKLSVSPFTILGDSDASLRKFTGGLQATMIDELSQNHLDVIEPGATSGTTYGFDGTIERDVDEFVVRARLVDMRQHVTVWAKDFRRGADDSGALQAEVSHVASNAAAVAVAEDARAKGDPETVGLFITANQYALGNRQEDREAEWQNTKLLLAKLPEDAGLHSNMAVISAFLAATTDQHRAVELRALTESEARAALKIDPHDDGAYVARSLVFPLVGHWGDREAALLDGLKVLPQSGGLTNHESNLLREVGRLKASVILARQAEAPKPPSANRESTLLLALAATNQTAEASSVADRVAAAWPTHPASWNSRLQALIFAARWDDALALFQPKTVQPAKLDEAERRAWILALTAMKSESARAKQSAVHAFASLPSARVTVVQPPNEIYSPAIRIGMIAVLGDKDEAFAEAEDYLQKGSYTDSAFLFWPNLEDFRRDKRFLELVTKIGLTGYWRKAGSWPDYCADQQLSYKCQ